MKKNSWDASNHLKINNLSPLIRSFPVFLLLVFITVLFGCSRIKIVHAINTEADFSKMKTYAWVPTKLEGAEKGLNVEYIEKAITSHLALKGFTLVADNPDFRVSAHITVHEIVTDLRNSGMDIGGSTIVRRSEGTLALGFIDRDSNKLLYQRTVELTIDYAQWTPGQREETINKIVQKLLEGFPPDPF